ncbi:MAG: hypothetical protein Q4G05_06375 [Clostridia bacterium]|nr:hypothetical protein [Clostridia bacterium]
MEYEKHVCPVVKIDGNIEEGKQFDLDITLPTDNRNVIYGIVKDCYKDPVCDAVVKLIEIGFEHGKEERKPVSHTFTDKHGEFVFGPLCENRFYEIEIWVNRVKHCKVCTKCEKEGSCLKGTKLDCPPPHPFKDCKEEKDCKFEKDFKNEKEYKFEKEMKKDCFGCKKF